MNSGKAEPGELSNEARTVVHGKRAELTRKDPVSREIRILRNFGTIGYDAYRDWVLNGDEFTVFELNG